MSEIERTKERNEIRKVMMELLQLYEEKYNVHVDVKYSTLTKEILILDKKYYTREDLGW